jgi:cbb3-type cytochrome oxidase maturation protein
LKVLYLLIPLGLVLVALALWGFFWAVRKGQFDDLDSPGMQILLDDDRAPRKRPTGTVNDTERRNA